MDKSSLFPYDDLKVQNIYRIVAVEAPCWVPCDQLKRVITLQKMKNSNHEHHKGRRAPLGSSSSLVNGSGGDISRNFHLFSRASIEKNILALHASNH
jgi:hypothetical protein